MDVAFAQWREPSARHREVAYRDVGRGAPAARARAAVRIVITTPPLRVSSRRSPTNRTRSNVAGISTRSSTSRRSSLCGRRARQLANRRNASRAWARRAWIRCASRVSCVAPTPRPRQPAPLPTRNRRRRRIRALRAALGPRPPVRVRILLVVAAACRRLLRVWDPPPRCARRRPRRTASRARAAAPASARSRRRHSPWAPPWAPTLPAWWRSTGNASSSRSRSRRAL